MATFVVGFFVVFGGFVDLTSALAFSVTSHLELRQADYTGLGKRKTQLEVTHWHVTWCMGEWGEGGGRKMGGERRGEEEMGENG